MNQHIILGLILKDILPITVRISPMDHVNRFRRVADHMDTIDVLLFLIRQIRVLIGNQINAVTFFNQPLSQIGCDKLDAIRMGIIGADCI